MGDIYKIKNKINNKSYNFDNRPTRQNYVIFINIPNKKRKKFCSKKLSTYENLKKAIDFKDNLINGHRSGGLP